MFTERKDLTKSKTRHFDRDGVKNTGAEGKIALRACLYNGK